MTGGGEAVAMLIGEGKEGPSEVASVTREGRRGEGSGDGRAKKREEAEEVRRGWRSAVLATAARGDGGGERPRWRRQRPWRRGRGGRRRGEREATEAEEKGGRGGEVKAVASADEIEEAKEVNGGRRSGGRREAPAMDVGERRPSWVVGEEMGRGGTVEERSGRWVEKKQRREGGEAEVDGEGGNWCQRATESSSGDGNTEPTKEGNGNRED